MGQTWKGVLLVLLWLSGCHAARRPDFRAQAHRPPEALQGLDPDAHVEEDIVAYAELPLIGAVTIGIASAALEEVLEVARKKTPAYMRVGLRDRDYVHTQIARARAKMGAARAYLY